MIGVELVAGYLAIWAWKKARRVAGRADAEVDQALDAGMDRLHELVAAKLGTDPALAQLEAEARAGAQDDEPTTTERTRRRVQLAVEEAADSDADFAGHLQRSLDDVKAALQQAGGQATAAGSGAVAVGGEVSGIVSTGSGAVNVQRR